MLIRAVQGHNKAIAHNPDTDFALATSYYSTLEKTEANLVATREGVPVLCLEDVPKILYHRTTRDSFQGILQGGLVAGSQGSGKIHNYFATCPVTSGDYRSGVRANAPIEIKWDTEKLLRSGCLLFTTRSDGVLCREDCSPAAIILSGKRFSMPSASMTFPKLHVVRLRQSRHPESGSFPQGKAFHLGMSLCPRTMMSTWRSRLSPR